MQTHRHVAWRPRSVLLGAPPKPDSFDVVCGRGRGLRAQGRASASKADQYRSLSEGDRQSLESVSDCRCAQESDLARSQIAARRVWPGSRSSSSADASSSARKHLVLPSAIVRYRTIGVLGLDVLNPLRNFSNFGNRIWDERGPSRTKRLTRANANPRAPTRRDAPIPASSGAWSSAG